MQKNILIFIDGKYGDALEKVIKCNFLKNKLILFIYFLSSRVIS